MLAISADSHVTEPGDCYLPRIDPRFRIGVETPKQSVAVDDLLSAGERFAVLGS